MGQQTSETSLDPARRQRLVQRILADVAAMERMIQEGRFETGVRRIGAEQELVFADGSGAPAPVAMEVLTRLDDERFTTELSIFNIEFNLPAIPLVADCLRRMEQGLTDALARIEQVTADLDAHPILVGILPTLRQSDLELHNITPRPRYLYLVEALRQARGEAYEFRFTGIDELILRHESVMLEACNTSSQFHLQVSPDEFAHKFNLAQAIAAPVLAAAVNSPLLFGRRLWRETRIALFQQAVDTRRPVHALEQRSARVRFGEAWVKESVLELFRDDISRFRVLLAEQDEEDPFAVLAQGGIPRLRALQLHNGTVYRWNRACYGVTDGQPHLRIENRVLPSGPTVVDEVANAAFWFGLMLGGDEHYGDIAKLMKFDDARSNFQLAAQIGLDAQLKWVDGWTIPAADLIRRILLPVAREGLKASGIDPADIDRYLGIIDTRVATRRTGARWLLDSFEALRQHRTPHQRLGAMVRGLRTRQRDGRPVHEWSLMRPLKVSTNVKGFQRVEQFMTTDLFTVHEDDVVDLAASVMDWKHVRHVPVEGEHHRLVGLISYRQLLRFMASGGMSGDRPVCVREVMQPDPITIAPETPTLEAIQVMRDHELPCLPVVRDGVLVGILTERDFMPIAGRLLEAKLREV